MQLSSCAAIFGGLRGKRVLVVGIGGGCDIISAYAVAHLLKEAEAGTIVYADTKRFCEDELEPVQSRVFRVPARIRPLRPGCEAHGTTLIEQSIPRGPDGCPFVLCLGDTQADRQTLQEEIESFAFDIVVAVDTGGDAVSDAPESGMEGRDKQMLRVLCGLSAECLLVVVAPGSDGESTHDDLRSVLDEDSANSRLRGWFSLEPALPMLSQLASPLEPTRTPNIIVSAFEDRLDSGDAPGELLVPRGIWPSIPRSWLTAAVVLEVAERARRS
jgi:Protein of unknown function (DUF1152)